MSTANQRSNEWHNARLGRLTGSEIHLLMGIKGLGLTGEDYAYKKACEIVFGRDEDNEIFVSYDMQRGIQYEPLAFDLFNRINQENFIEATKCDFFEYKDFAGASPDGIVSDDAVLEIKCPKPETFFKLLKDNEVKKDYLYQMQMEMLCANKSKAYFFNFIIWNGQPLHHTIIVERDEELIAKILGRVLEAVLLRDEFVERIRKNIQFDLP